MPETGLEVHLASRPVGEPALSDFALVQAQVAVPGEGQIVVRNDWLSVDPYMRGRMNDVKSYVPPFKVGEVMDGAAVGTVVESRAENIPAGTAVLHQAGWREYATLKASAVQPVDVDGAPGWAYLGVLGMTGLTAYAALRVVAPVREGDVVFISGAAGAVGLAAGAIARKLGASRVIGSAGGPEKNRRLVEEFGYDGAIDYREGALEKQLRELAPDGIDVYLDNVGGDHLRAAISTLNNHGRVALCGAISQYNNSEPTPGPDNLMLAVGKRLTLRGFIVSDHFALQEEFLDSARGWLAEGSLPDAHTEVAGIENAAQAFIDLLRGGNVGKMVVRLGS
ncbi:NADP-dependent oxidoreductase [Actinokineospora pegani]|uniref:NADP-dependent oxidoreductase n=1 Tax=Actinokineospora pegani TaxID=2654637 RepID=UPI0012EA5669|nr:NADP-dependent oxidoreductase [Actinokineospora pegani]